MPSPNDHDPLRTTDHEPGAAPPGGDDVPDVAPTPSVLDGHTGPYVPGAAAEPQGAEPCPAAVWVPGYDIESVLGRGGVGVVYKARHLALKRAVALKMIRAGGHAGPAELARFRLEAEAVARLQQPNIVHSGRGRRSECPPGGEPGLTSRNTNPR